MKLINHSATDRVQVITAGSEWWDIDWAELWRYRDLIYLFVRRDFVAYYKQTILGPLWFFIQPIFTVAIMTVVFSKWARLSTDGLPPPLFYLSGLLAWNYFASCLNATAGTFVTHAQIFGKVYFPRLCVPLATVLSNLIQFAIQAVLFLLVWAAYAIHGEVIAPTWYLLGLPMLIIQLAALGLGCGLMVSALTTRYRDLALAVGFGVQLWLYLTPVFYPASTVSAHLHLFYALNPMVGIIEYFRLALLGDGVLRFAHLAFSFGVTAFALIGGVIMFHRVEKSFTDTV